MIVDPGDTTKDEKLTYVKYRSLTKIKFYATYLFEEGKPNASEPTKWIVKDFLHFIRMMDHWIPTTTSKTGVDGSEAEKRVLTECEKSQENKKRILEEETIIIDSIINTTANSNYIVDSTPVPKIASTSNYTNRKEMTNKHDALPQIKDLSRDKSFVIRKHPGVTKQTI